MTDVLTRVAGANSTRNVRLVKGSHIIVPKFWEGPHSYLVQNDDKRVIFINAYEGNKALIGTTDIAYDGRAEDVAIDDYEISYLLDCVNRYFKEKLRREDILETFFMNFFHCGRLAAMPPKLLNDEGDVVVLRPLGPCAEADLEKFAEAMQFPIIPCDLCGSQDGLQRQQVKQILDGWERNSPGRRQVMFRSLMNARPSHLLDSGLFDFAGLQRRNAEDTALQNGPDAPPKLR